MIFRLVQHFRPQQQGTQLSMSLSIIRPQFYRLAKQNFRFGRITFANELSEIAVQYFV